MKDQKKYEYSFYLGVCLTLLIAAILYSVGIIFPNLNKELVRVLANISINITSAIIVAIIFAQLANREFKKLIEEQLQSFKIEASKEASEFIKKHEYLHPPIMSFNAAMKPNPLFNEVLDEDVCSSTFYFFKGVSGKYLPIRLKDNRHKLHRVQVLILDPTDEESLLLRAKDKYNTPPYIGMSIPEIKEEIKKEIYFCLVNIFDCRHICQIDIAFQEGTAVYRIELFDDSLYLSSYLTKDSIGMLFPESFKYAKSSLHYHIYKEECLRQFQVSKNKISFQNSSTENDLLNSLNKLGLILKSDQIDSIRKEYKSFEKKFKNKINTVPNRVGGLD